MALTASIVLALAGPGVAAAQGSTWHFETLDGTGSTQPGHTTDNVGASNHAIVFHGQLHVFTYDVTTFTLRHEWWDGIRWNFETLDGTGSSWAGHTTDHVGISIAVATLDHGQLNVFTQDGATFSLRHEWWDGIRWNFETLDGTGSTWAGHTTDHVGVTSGVVVIHDGQFHVFTLDDTIGSLRHEWWDGIRWNFETLDGTGSTWAGHTTDNVGLDDVVAVFDTQLHVFTYDTTAHSLHHEWWDGTRWNFETLDGTGSTRAGHTTDNVGAFDAVTAFNGQLHVFAEDQTRSSLRHDWWG